MLLAVESLDMSVIAEFRIDATDFAFGEALRTDPSTECILERIVPTGANVMPYVWVRNTDSDAFESAVRDEPRVGDLTLVDDLGDNQLYRVTWNEDIHDLIYEINQSSGVILSGSGRDTWRFQIRFPDHSDLKRFHERLEDVGIGIHLDRVSTFTMGEDLSDVFSLTEEQEEALTFAYHGGYFDVPRKTTTQSLADELGISDQAFSERIRRGVKALLQSIIE